MPLTFGGRLTVIKHVLCLTLFNPMSLSLFSKASFSKFERLFQGFLWAEKIGVQKIHVARWGLVITNKQQGGLGVFNMRMMA
eukprot:c49488_g1_i1 orf=30-275(+)